MQESDQLDVTPTEVEVAAPEESPAVTEAPAPEPEVEGADVAPVEIEPEGNPDVPEEVPAEAKDPGTSMGSDGGAVQETPFRTQ